MIELPVFYSALMAECRSAMVYLEVTYAAAIRKVLKENGSLLTLK